MTAAAGRTRGVALLLACVFATVALLGIVLTAVRATASFEAITETGRPGYLMLAAHSATPLHDTLGPGETMRWLVEASLADAERSTLAIELDASGELLDASAMTAGIAACTGAFEADAHGDGPDAGADPARVPCDGEQTVVLPATPLSQLARRGDRFELADLRRDDPRQLLVHLSIPATADADAAAGLVARVGVGVHADGGNGVRPVQPTDPPDSRLPVTGADALALGVLAFGLAGLGASLAVRGRALRGRALRGRALRGRALRGRARRSGLRREAS